MATDVLAKIAQSAVKHFYRLEFSNEEPIICLLCSESNTRDQVAGHSLKSEQMYLFTLSNLQPTGRAGALAQPLASENQDCGRKGLFNCFTQSLSLKQLAPRGKSREQHSQASHPSGGLKSTCLLSKHTDDSISDVSEHRLRAPLPGLLLVKCFLPIPKLLIH